MIVLSLFDGISCGQVALERSGIKVDKYFASEIDKYAIKVTQANYPNTIQLGDIRNIKGKDLPQIDLLIGGFPCQSFSFCGKQLNFNDPRGKLFFECVRLLDECKPKYFLFENVKMKKEYQDTISKMFGIEPIKINSSLVSAQHRERLYWTNIPNIFQPIDKNILIQSIIEENADPKYNLTEKARIRLNKYINGYKCIGKSPTLTCELAHSTGKNMSPKLIEEIGLNRRSTPLECERLQTLPDNYTNHASDTQRYKMLGNCWTVDVVKHIFDSIPRTT